MHMTYNGVRLTLCSVERIAIERVLLPDFSDTYLALSLEVTGIVCGKGCKDTQQKLLAPRKELELTILGKELIKSNSVEGNTPQEATIIPIKGSENTVVRFRIAASIPEAKGGDPCI